MLLRALLLTLILTGCATYKPEAPPELVSIHLVDRDGLSESISNPDRLRTYASTDFLDPQPYQKVFRVYGRDQEGSIHAYITSYHPNGQVKQYLEIINNRAFGAYREWHANGVLKVETTIIEGSADLSIASEKSWIFDGCCHAWNESGNLLADIPYMRGSLEGIARYYHPNGTLWKEVPYVKNQISGELRVYLESGELLQSTEYVKDIKEGKSLRYWSGTQIAAEEYYQQGRLLSASYSNLQGEQIACIENGNGLRALFAKEGLSELQEYRLGFPEGEVKVFNNKGNLVKRYFVKNGMKHGEELIYFATIPGKDPQPKLLMNWYEGKIQGIVKTWYDNGTVESQREMSENKRNGVATAWYRTGQLMLIEEYEHGKLKKGDYFRKGDRQPITQVFQGEGTVSYFDADGNYLRKVSYHHGKPEV